MLNRLDGDADFEPEMRRDRLEAAIELAIAVLNRLDGDADFEPDSNGEPSLAFPEDRSGLPTVLRASEPLQLMAAAGRAAMSSDVGSDRELDEADFEGDPLDLAELDDLDTREGDDNEDLEPDFDGEGTMPVDPWAAGAAEACNA